MRCELPLLLVMLVLVASSGTPTKRLDKLIELLDGMKSHETWKTEENALFGASREAAASKWMAKTNEEYREWTRRSSLVYWDYMTNLTDENADKTSVVSNQLSDWLRIAIEEGKDHATQSTAQWDSSLVRQLNTLSNLQGTPVAKESATQKYIIT
ncbi:hypothetical protein CAPTEDRAFT_194849 [Capitella teleta]|uniref:SXP/RAL-2 family protein Ani s 5-like cation-binding domain-containing protein n=1 Tax=Capitella teleta TaxID=283909 RepID=R7T3C6_CAPTE|nr:hypothetical protein CAPTEDRAFT_194849 [Capitella teleta]|eukprot:ELT87207.1 hypothetical protein CAPTEDRAFT_194849 [Capitella teleta]